VSLQPLLEANILRLLGVRELLPFPACRCDVSVMNTLVTMAENYVFQSCGNNTI